MSYVKNKDLMNATVALKLWSIHLERLHFTATRKPFCELLNDASWLRLAFAQAAPE